MRLSIFRLVDGLISFTALPVPNAPILPGVLAMLVLALFDVAPVVVHVDVAGVAATDDADTSMLGEFVGTPMTPPDIRGDGNDRFDVGL
uniref:Uncharacterized protein n=1 Tax=Glossina palpalis gambiensis TaxID=67801 RepID=A0A1B0C5N0_9MUSC